MDVRRFRFEGPTDSSMVDKLVDVYSKSVSSPSPVSGRILVDSSDRCVVSTISRQRNLEQQLSTQIYNLYDVDLSRKHSTIMSTLDVTNEVLSAQSASDKLRCVIRQLYTSEGRQKSLIEVWQDGRLSLNIDLTGLDIHGPVHTNTELGSIAFSPDEKFVVYLAERKTPRTSPFYQKNHVNGSAPNQNGGRGDQYVFSEDWGEQLQNLRMTDIVVLNIESETLRILKGVPENYCAGQVVFDSVSNGVYGIAFDILPRKLGLYVSNNRHAVLFHLSFSGQFTEITEKGMAPLYPRLSPNGATLIWYQRAAGGPNFGTSSLMKLDVKTQKVNVLIPIISNKIEIMDEKPFYGVYALNPPVSRGFSDHNWFIFDSVCEHSNKIYAVSLDDGKIKLVGNGSVLDVLKDKILITSSSLTKPTQVVLTSLENTFGRVDVSRVPVLFKHSEPVFDQVASGNMHYQLLEPQYGPSLPLIVRPHGGPHLIFTDSFNEENAFFVKLGFAILYVNYRGSIGYGEDFVNLLPGHVGVMDVSDTHDAVKHVLARHAELDKDKVYFYAGSHGGFIALHLAGLYPNFYKALVVRGANVELSIRYMASDIPDWSAVEAGFGPFNAGHNPTDDEWQLLRDRSPLRHVENITAPVLFLIGNQDRRMPYFQSIYMYKILKARGIKTKLMLYNDGHTLTSVAAHMDAAINAALWLLNANQ